MRETTDNEIIFTILDILFKKGKWGGAHISYDKIVRWIAVKIKRNGRRVKKVLNDLIKSGFVLRKPTHYGFEISLNPRKYNKIIQIIKRF